MLSSCLKMLNKIILFLWKIRVCLLCFSMFVQGHSVWSGPGLDGDLLAPLTAPAGSHYPRPQGYLFNSLGILRDFLPSQSEGGARRAWLASLLSPYSTSHSLGLFFGSSAPSSVGSEEKAAPHCRGCIVLTGFAHCLEEGRMDGLSMNSGFALPVFPQTCNGASQSLYAAG